MVCTAAAARARPGHERRRPAGGTAGAGLGPAAAGTWRHERCRRTA
jgi:hypothetical protein